MTGSVTVLVVDDHPIFRAGMTTVLADLPEVRVVGEAIDGIDAVTAVARLLPDIVLMDLRMPRLSGIEATARITAAHPKTAVVVLTMDEDTDTLFAALRAGARGYLLKEAEVTDIMHALLTVSRGGAVFGPSVARRVLNHFDTPADRCRPQPFPELTDRECEVLTLLSQGLDNTSIAHALHLSEKTIRNRVSDVLAKLRVRSRAEAVALARDAGLGTCGGESNTR